MAGWLDGWMDGWIDGQQVSKGFRIGTAFVNHLGKTKKYLKCYGAYSSILLDQ
jgi:hypothetical protein